jgi:hypothetical protein
MNPELSFGIFLFIDWLIQKGSLSLYMTERKLNEATAAAMQLMLLGKRVKVTGCKSKYPMPDGTYNLGNVIGECTFFGYNQHFPEFVLQITVDRMPLFNINILQVNLLDD